MNVPSRSSRRTSRCSGSLDSPMRLSAGSIEGLQQASVPAGVKVQIEDYWTNPNATQVETLYSLAPGQDVAAIAQQPLGCFLVTLDPEQKGALAKLKADGPYLLKGSAGTGKSLVGLYYLRDLITTQANLTMFDDTPARYGVITYPHCLAGQDRLLARPDRPRPLPAAHRGGQPQSQPLRQQQGRLQPTALRRAGENRGRQGD